MSRWSVTLTFSVVFRQAVVPQEFYHVLRVGIDHIPVVIDGFLLLFS